MRLSLKGYNLAALAVLSTPAVLIFEASARSAAVHPGARAAYYAALAGGVALLGRAMGRLSDERTDAAVKPLGGAAVLLGGAAALLFVTALRG